MGTLAYAHGLPEVAVQTVADETFETKVERRLRMDGRIRFEGIKAEASTGEVTLYGIVNSIEE